MAERGEEVGGSQEVEESFSFVDKVRYMMYGEQEKEAFLIEKKEKEEKKKAKQAAKKKEPEKGQKKQGLLGQIKDFVVGPSDKSPNEPQPPPNVSGEQTEYKQESSPTSEESKEPVA